MSLREEVRKDLFSALVCLAFAAVFAILTAVIHGQSTSRWHTSVRSCDPADVEAGLNALSPQQARDAKLVPIPYGGSLNNCYHINIIWEQGR